MESIPGSEFTVVELKEAFRERGLSANGTKIELIKRLSEKNPGVWEELEARRRSDAGATDLLGSADARRPTVDDGIVGEAAAGSETRVREERLSVAAVGVEKRDIAMRTELVLLRRERECWEREQQLLRRELEVLRNSPATRSATTDGGVTAASGGANIRGVKELLPEFDGTDNAFWRWGQQLQLLMQSYHLDENSTRILISSRLRGRALSWFHSKAEHLVLSVEELLKEMEQMFDLRPGKLALRKEFESRVWRGGESFCDYYHDKMILANRIPIAEDEILDYLIEGVTDQRLQNQARMMNYRTRAELLKAFEKVRPEDGRSSDARARKDGARTISGRKSEVPPVRSNLAKCFRCLEVGHLATHCRRAPVCYV